MAKYHINPKTGSPSVCKATEKRGCPYEGVSEHFDTPEEARKSYEENQERIQHHHFKSPIAQVKGAVTLSAYDPFDSDSEVQFKKFRQAMDKAPDGTILVTNEGDIYEKRTLNGAYGNDSWSRRNKKPQGLSASRLEKNQSYNSIYFMNDVLNHGGRLELQGAHFYPDVDYTEELGRKVDPNAAGYKKLSDAELAKELAATLNSDTRLFYDFGEAPNELKDKLGELEDELRDRQRSMSKFLKVEGYGKTSVAKPLRGLSQEGIKNRD